MEGGKKAGGRKQPHCHPPNYWLGWQGRRRKADIVYLIKSKQQFAAASLPLAVCRALRAGDSAFAPAKPGSFHHTPSLGSPRALSPSLGSAFLGLSRGSKLKPVVSQHPPGWDKSVKKLSFGKSLWGERPLRVYTVTPGCAPAGRGRGHHLARLARCLAHWGGGPAPSLPT